MEMVMEKNINRILTYNKSAKETWQIFFYIYNKKNMKQLSLILLISTFSFCQTNFQFDYHLEYEFIHHVDSTKSEKKIYLTNSNDNSYNLEAERKLLFKKYISIDIDVFFQYGILYSIFSY